MAAYPTPAGQIWAIASGPDGNIWYTSLESNAIGRITLQGKVDEFPIPTLHASPYGIAAGPDGNLWFTESQLGAPSGNGKIGRITPQGQITEYTDDGLSFPRAITRGPDGAVWATLDGSANLVRVTADGRMTFVRVTWPGALDITVGPDGNLWLANDPIERVS